MVVARKYAFNSPKYVFSPTKLHNNCTGSVSLSVLPSSRAEREYVTVLAEAQEDTAPRVSREQGLRATDGRRAALEPGARSNYR
jgi:hypothetical protein